MVYPIEEYKGKNKADTFVWKFIDNNYKDDIFSIHNIQVESIVIDSVLFCVDKGVLLLNTKDYLSDEIIEVTSQHMVKFINRQVNYTGFPQICGSREVFINNVDIQRHKSLIVGVCNYPFIDEAGFKRTGMDKVMPRELVLLKEDWQNKSCFDSAINKIFNFVNRVNDFEEQSNFNRKEIEKICYAISPKYGDAVKKYKCTEAQEITVDLHVTTSKELYYGISSFLMKNGITRGYICSQSKELLDGLGEYMTAVKIPWSYEKDVDNSIGYKFIDELLNKESLPKGSVIISLHGDSSIYVSQGRKKSYNIEIHNRNKIYENIKKIDIEHPIHLKNEQIREMFLKSFVVAEKEIDIISPWMNFGVVNEYFVELMDSALSRGVVIKIIYGLTPDSSEFNISRSNRSDQVAKFLLERFREYKNQLFIKRDNIHYKLVLCDEKFKLEGGYNYLSFVGDYDNKTTRREGSPFGTQVDEIRYLRKEYFG